MEDVLDDNMSYGSAIQNTELDHSNSLVITCTAIHAVFATIGHDQSLYQCTRNGVRSKAKMDWNETE